MYLSSADVLIIGAGPYGLSISAHMRERGISHCIVGRVVDAWRAHMPAGMNLKSEPFASDISSPTTGYGITAYCRSLGLDYGGGPGVISIERFIGYADWYADQLVPDIRDVTVTEVSAFENGFRVGFANAEPLTPKQVVVATGVLPYAFIPAELAGLPRDLVSHTTDHHQLTSFGGRKVAVVGGGQSALETAALLHEAGADTSLVLRRPAISWLNPNPERVSRIGRIRRPHTKLCAGWPCTLWNSPSLFRLLPQDTRVLKARTVLGPAGSWWLKDRVEGMVDVLAAHHLGGVVANGSGVRLLIDGPKRSALDVDHVVAGTGFRVDIAQLPFLSEQLRAKVATVNGYPMLNRASESTVPGLYFAGANGTVSLGPAMRFVAGTHNTARQIAGSVVRRSAASRRHAKVGENRDLTSVSD